MYRAKAEVSQIVSDTRKVVDLMTVFNASRKKEGIKPKSQQPTLCRPHVYRNRYLCFIIVIEILSDVCCFTVLAHIVQLY